MRRSIERLRFFILPLRPVKLRQIVQARGGVRMIRAQPPLTDSQRPLIERLRFSVLPLQDIEQRQVVQARGGVRMIRARAHGADVSHPAQPTPGESLRHLRTTGSETASRTGTT